MRHAAFDYGPGIASKLKDEIRAMNDSSMDSSVGDPDLAAMPPKDNPGHLIMHLRRKRQAALLKGILKQGGYGDLSRQVSFRKEEEEER